MKYQILAVDCFSKSNIIPIDENYDLEQMKCIVKGLELNDLQEHTYYIVVEGE